MSRTVRQFILLALACVALTAATAPTRDEWTPVEKAIRSGAADAESQLAAITQRFPEWPDGHRELARLRLNRKDDAGALAAAQKAVDLSFADAKATPDADAASLAIQALTRLDRMSEGFAIAERFPGNKDVKGWVNYAAAGAAFAIPDLPRAEKFLVLAKERAAQNIPAAFHLLDSRIALSSNDLRRAETSLRSAVTTDGTLLDAWYELGRVQSALATQDPKRAEEYYGKATESFQRVAMKLSDDYESWFGLGRAQLELGKLRADQTAGEGGGDSFRQAVLALGKALERQPDLADAHLALGEAHLRLAAYDLAVTHLRRAQQLGARDRSLDFNLALALGKSGRADEAEAVIGAAQAISAGEKVTKGMSSYKAGNHELALAMLRDALDDDEIARDAVAAAAVRRFVGHAHAGIAERARKTADTAATAKAETDALAAYRTAGDAGDTWAQRHFLALADGMDSSTAYAAGLTFLGWRKWLAPAGWKVAIRHYGESKAWRDPIHLGVWGVIIGLPLILWLKSLFRRKPKTIPGDSRPGATPAARRKRPEDLQPSSAAAAGAKGALEPRSELRSTTEVRKRKDDETRRRKRT